MPDHPPHRQPAADVDVIFVGRGAELAQLHALLERARAGEPRLVVIQGPAGIGKTALANRLLGQAPELQVLRASGEESEAALAFGILDQLVAHGPAPPPDPLAGLSHRAQPQVDPMVAGAALVDLLGALQHAGPVAIVVDDAHWADSPSLHALTFALRRLRVDRVLTLILVRDAADLGLPSGLRRLLASDQTLRIALGGLDVEELRTLSGQLGAASLSPRAAARLHGHTHGNPLHARTLLEQLPAEILSDPDMPLPVPRSFGMLVLARLAACSTETQALVAAASVLGLRCRVHQAATVAGLREPLAALEQAITTGLLVEELDSRMVRFLHPLVHAAVYRQLGPARRSALHTKAAEFAEDEPARLRHRACAASGPDPVLSADLARLGHQQSIARAWASAGQHLAAAARLSTSRTVSEQLTLEAVECRLLAGDLPDPAAVTAQLRTFGDTAWRSYLLGRLAFVAGRLDETEALLHDAWRRCDADTDPVLAARVAGQLTAICGTRLRGAKGARWADLALRLAPDQIATDFIHVGRLTGLATSGHADEALAAVADLPDPAVASAATLDILLGRGMLRIWTDDLGGARRDLAGVLAAGQDRSVAFQVLAAGMLGLAEYRLGAWDDAIVHCDLALSLAADADLVYLIPFGHTVATLVPAARGQWDEAESHAHAAPVGVLGGALSTLIHATTPPAHIARARGEPEAVIAALEPLLHLDRREDIDEPGIVVWQDILADALVAVGDLDRAAALLDPFEALAAARGRRAAMAAAARVRGNLQAARGDHQGANTAFQAGMRHLAGLDLPFEHALLELAYGAWVRRTGKRSAAVALLKGARERLARLGARPYLERCDQELAACGLAPARHRKLSGTRLTPQEAAVAQLAATGRTNQQIARELVLSVKTVEYHLGHVYAKLLVTSRVQLASSLARD